MWILIAILVGLGVITALFNVFDPSRPSQRGEVKNNPSCATCDGSNAGKCEQECMMEAATKEIEYYEDEELDAYIGREADQYSDEEAEEFREVLYTMKPNEVAGWNRSLVLRGINLPNQLKDEIVMMLNG